MKFDGVKKLKRTFYRSRATKFKSLIAIMAVIGIIASIGYFAKCAYVRYAVSGAEIVLTYPEIAQSRYPDGKRFTYYDLISDENLEKTLEIMHKDGKYKSFTVDDIRDSFYLYSYLEDSAGASVTISSWFSRASFIFFSSIVNPSLRPSSLLKRAYRQEYEGNNYA